ncbi:MAG: family 43 glycosylhydrolase [Lachnospiraceae bacterium]|nr:family 43 glycosylhydrolase [Lachnospiraceae bacterium]
MNSITTSSKYLIIAYTRNIKEDYSEFLGHSVHFAVSADFGKTIIPLYHNYGKLFPKCEFNDENGIISMGIMDIEIYKIRDEYIITAKEIRRIPLGNGEFSKSETGSFVRWTTNNFISFSEPVVTKERYTKIEKQIKDNVSTAFGFDDADYAESGVSVPISEDIAAALIKNNITVEYESTELPKTVTVSSRKELGKVTAKIKYTDGSVHEKRVNWKTDGIDFSKPGSYVVEGKIVVRHFDFPVENHPWGDPVITYYRGQYYWIATNDANGDTSFEIREADTPEALFDKNVRRSVVLSAETSVYKNTFWAPEFHIVGDKMRIFCALTVGTGFDPQCYVMTLKDDGDMLNPDDWGSPVRCVMPDGRNLCENPLGDGKNGITLDMTCFEAGKKSYAVWSYRTWTGTDSGSMLMIAENNPEKPWEMLTFPQLLSRPVYGWENNNGTDNNEGPFALVTDEKVYLAYSGGDARGQSYVVGLLTANVRDNLCYVSNWEILGTPSLASNFVAGEYGCGHNAFFTDEYGDVYITYHGVDAPFSRDIRPGIRRVHLAIDGNPILYMSNEQDLPERARDIRIVVVIES